MNAATARPFPATGVLPLDEEEKIARKIAEVLKGCETIEDLVGTCPTTFTDAVEFVAWTLYAKVWTDYTPFLDYDGPPEGTVARWIRDEAYGGHDWYQSLRADELKQVAS